MNKPVFISYSNNDEKQAKAICVKLESSNIKCWIAPRDISPSKDWAEEIIDAINSAEVMVLVFSSNSNTSPQVRREIERAVHKGLHILPFRIEDVMPSKSLEYFISTQHWLDASSGSFDKHLDELYRCIKAFFEDETNTDCMPEPEPVLEEAISSAVSFAVSELKYVSAQLANYIGPMAKIIVDKKAEESSSLKELIHLLSNELDNEIERNRFIEACMSIVDTAPP